MRAFLRHNRGWFLLILTVLALILPSFFSFGTDGPGAWACLPVAMVLFLSLLTGELYAALPAAILSAALLVSDYNLTDTVSVLFQTLSEGVGAPVHLCTLLLLVLFGCFVALLWRSGGAELFARLIDRRARSPKTVLFTATGLSALLSTDPYASILVGGSIMRPITDRFRISRAKLALILSTTAAPICLLVPITGWATAVWEGSGWSAFVAAIPYCFYTVFVLLLLFFSLWLGTDFSAMRREDRLAEQGLANHGSDEAVAVDVPLVRRHGHLMDMLLPILALVLCCLLGLLYVGGAGRISASITGDTAVSVAEGTPFLTPDGRYTVAVGELTLPAGHTFPVSTHGETLISPEQVPLLDESGATLYLPAKTELTLKDPDAVTLRRMDPVTALSRASAPQGLALGFGVAVILTMLFYVIRGVLSFRMCMDAMLRGFRAVVPAVFLLVLAWMFGDLLSGQLHFGSFLSGLLTGLPGSSGLLPLLVFLICLLFTFAVGSPMSTVAILLPVLLTLNGVPQALCLGALLSGAAAGGHLSPVSETLALSSAAAECDALTHFKTQLPYGLCSALCAAVGFLVGGVSENGLLGFAAALGVFALLLLVLLLRKSRRRRDERQ